MAIDVRVRREDGTEVIYRVNTDDPDEARRRVRARQAQERQEGEARARAGANGPGGAAGRIAGQAGRPETRTPYQRAYAAIASEHRPRTPVGRFNEQAFGWQDQMFRNMGIADEAAGAGQWLRQATGNLARRAQGQEPGIPANTVAQAAMDFERSQQRRFERERPLSNTIANIASVPAFGGSPVALARNPSLLGAGAAAAGVNAPFALARQEGSLQERLPGAAQESAVAFGLGAGAQGLANMIGRAGPTRAQQMADRMERAGASVDAIGAPATPRGVTPSLATANRGAGVSAPATNLVADNIFAGAPARGRLRRAAEETRDAVHDVRDAYGRARGREDAGRTIHRGLERYADDANAPNPDPSVHPRNVSTREWSFAAQSAAVFDEALRPIASNQAALTNTRSVLSQIVRRADDPAVREFRPDPVLKQFIAALRDIRQGGRTPTLRDLRKLRSDIRAAQTQPRLGPDATDNAALQRIEQALTEDIYAAAGPHAANLRAADQFYRRGMTRIEGVRRFFDPENPSASIQQILRAASPRTENARVLASLRSALPDREWRVVAASIIDEMGAPTPGARGFVAEQGFDLARFATAYRNMTPRARRIIFGSRGGQGGQSGATMRQLADDLDNLAAVADAQKGVMAGANSSGSATHLQNIGSIGLLVNPGTAAGTLLAVAGGLLTGEILTNPALVRWLVSAQRAGARSGMRRQLEGLRQIASRDPALMPFYTELVRRVSESSPLQADQQGARSQQPPERMSALQ